jgi:Domain of unknown function DUF29
MATRNAPTYEDDFVAWLEDQAQRVRHRQTDGLDFDNIAEELEGLARSDRREIRSRLTVLLIHLLKYKFQPRRRSQGWRGTIAEQRGQIATVIDDSPSLRSYPAAILASCYIDARGRAATETALPEATFPEECPFSLEHVLDPRWLP